MDEVPAEIVNYARMVALIGARKVGDTFLIRGDLPRGFLTQMHTAARQFGYSLRTRKASNGRYFLITPKNPRASTNA